MVVLPVSPYEIKVILPAASFISISRQEICLVAEITLVLPILYDWAEIVPDDVIPPLSMVPSFNKTLSIVTPAFVVVSLIVSTESSPCMVVLPVSPYEIKVILPALSFISISRQEICLVAEITLVLPILYDWAETVP